jgi:hypothetical protein
MKKKKETPRSFIPDWKTILTIFGILVILVLVLSGKATPKKINIFGLELEFNSTTVVSTSTPQITPETKVSSMQPVTLSEPTPTITAAPTISFNQDNWSGVLSIRKPTLNEIRQNKTTIWEANNFTIDDMLSPDILSMGGTVEQGKEYLWPIYWCAKDQETLTQNVENITTIFAVNGEVIPDKYIFNYDYNLNSGWMCNYHATVISGWQNDSKYALRVERVFKMDINDGQQSYPAGSYVYELNISIK